jgi:hypothetical protein
MGYTIERRDRYIGSGIGWLYRPDNFWRSYNKQRYDYDRWYADYK